MIAYQTTGFRFVVSQCQQHHLARDELIIVFLGFLVGQIKQGSQFTPYLDFAARAGDAGQAIDGLFELIDESTHVDTGPLEQGAATAVILIQQGHQQMQRINVLVVAAYGEALSVGERFLQLGREFVEVFQVEAGKLKQAKWLAQGTIYPDVIESAGTQNNGAAVVIKSHHNVGGLPETMNLKLLEPIRELFKDEVRKIGLELGLPSDMVYRHPFPGPGLGVRILGEVKKKYADILRSADAIFIEELHEAGLYQQVSQAFAVFLPIKSVGVMGDGRRYDYVICLRAVETIDFMTAHWAHLPWDFLGKVSNRIINEVPGVSRVTYDISGKPPATIEWE